MNHFVLLVFGLAAIAAPTQGCTCGLENLQTRIINGKVAQKDRYPWMVSILTKKDGSYSGCGGALINDRYVLTAAHCLDHMPLSSDVNLMLGAHQQNERWHQADNRQKLDVHYYVLHGWYNKNVTTGPYDIAVIKLKNPVPLGNKWRPICLPNFSQHTNLFAYGWGDQNQNKEKVSAQVMHEIELDEVDNTTCTNKYWGPKFLPQQHICAGTRGGTCQGDSGGPISTRHRGHVYEVGVVSFGVIGCGIKGNIYPDISQRVTFHLPWIQKFTSDAKWCSGPDVPEFTLKNLVSPTTSNAIQNYNPSPVRSYTPSYNPNPRFNSIQPRPATNAPAGVCTCGVENLQTRIINGKVAQKDRYPWMVSILTKKDGSYNGCGGALINDRYVLTAAHCLDHMPLSSDVNLMLGAHQQNERWRQADNRQKLDVHYYVLHGWYNKSLSGSPYDVAVIKLKNPVPLGNKWRPVCLPNFSQHTNLFAYGWGDQNQNNEKVSAQVMHEIELDEVDNSTCTNNYWGSTFIPQQHICAGTRGGTCQGDSGGPISTRHRGHIYEVGVVSFGVIGCGIKGNMLPDISQRVTFHLPWIQKFTSDAKWCFGPDVPEFTLKNLANRS